MTTCPRCELPGAHATEVECIAILRRDLLASREKRRGWHEAYENMLTSRNNWRVKAEAAHKEQAAAVAEMKRAQLGERRAKERLRQVESESRDVRRESRKHGRLLRKVASVAMEAR